MTSIYSPLSRTFNSFFDSEKTSGILMIFCTIISLAISNSRFGEQFINFWQSPVLGLSIEHWINDGLMAIFFLLIGLELERELYSGELSDWRNALLPIFAAVGGLALPAMIYFGLNINTPTENGIGIPMATDIAFALAAIALLGNRVPGSVKVFITALAIIDDLGAIILIALFYTAKLEISYLIAALGVFALMLVLNKILRIASLLPYIFGGAIMWYLMFKSGVHATIAGVLLAFVIPYSKNKNNEASPSHRLENLLHKPVAFLILPIFALANTGMIVNSGWISELSNANSLGILTGLIIGKPLGITLLSYLAVTLGICRLPFDMSGRHIFGAGLLGGIGFTMSIFIANLAFAGQGEVINSSKIAILFASLLPGAFGYIYLRLFASQNIAANNA